MRLVAVSAGLLLTLSAAPAFAAGSAGGGAIANNTSTSMGKPKGSPSYSAPRSAVVPGLPPQEREAQRLNAQEGKAKLPSSTGTSASAH